MSTLSSALTPLHKFGRSEVQGHDVVINDRTRATLRDIQARTDVLNTRPLSGRA